MGINSVGFSLKFFCGGKQSGWVEGFCLLVGLGFFAQSIKEKEDGPFGQGGKKKDQNPISLYCHLNHSRIKQNAEGNLV